MPPTDLCFLPATDLAARIRAKEFSAREVMEAHLAQIERVNPQVNAIVTDSRPPEEPKEAKGLAVYEILALFLSDDEKASWTERLRQGGVGYGDLKKEIMAKMDAQFGAARQPQAVPVQVVESPLLRHVLGVVTRHPHERGVHGERHHPARLSLGVDEVEGAPLFG